MDRVHYTKCPVCNSDRIRYLMTLKDHSVSFKKFDVWHCDHCEARFTQDVPGADFIGLFYQSVEYVSHSNSSDTLTNRTYQRVRKYTLESKAKLVISNTAEKGKMLDMGAGIGSFVQTMREKGWDAVGIEPEPQAQYHAKELYDMKMLEPHEIDDLEKGSFDAITLWHVMEHLHDLHGHIEKFKALLKPGGKLFVAVPNYKSADSNSYTKFWAAYDVPRHLYHFSPKSMEFLMKQHDLKITEKKPMWFDPYYVCLLSSKYKNGRPSWISASIIGTWSNFRALLNKNKASSLIYLIEKDH